MLLKKGKQFRSINQLTLEIGKQLDIDPSIFRKPTSDHRKLLNKYLKDLVSKPGKELDEPSVDALKIRNLELTRKVSILEKELKNPQNKLALVAPKPAKANSKLFDLDSLCMLIDDILKCQKNLQFKNGALYNLETFSEVDELVSIKNNCTLYLDWKNGR
ncbi:hypothetical protein ACUUYP_06975 [Pseudomonas lundensis]|uniref:hypothetical protein n=1 Tax=Pseudomonas lundensis TaxID=86185 RepID=UPI0040459173